MSTSVHERVSGGCACGKVRYETSGTFAFSLQCHCRKCQRATGTGHAPAFAVEVEKTRLAGPVKYYGHVSDSGTATRTGFCSACGSPIVSVTERFPERFYFLAATLDDTSGFEPEFAVFADQSPPWDPVPEKLKSWLAFDQADAPVAMASATASVITTTRTTTRRSWFHGGSA